MMEDIPDEQAGPLGGHLKQMGKTFSTSFLNILVHITSNGWRAEINLRHSLPVNHKDYNTHNIYTLPTTLLLFYLQQDIFSQESCKI